MLVQLRQLVLLATIVAIGLVVPGAAGIAEAQEAQAKVPPAVDLAARATRLKTMRNVKSWGYQLRQINLAAIARSPLDLVVIDHALSSRMRFALEFRIDKIQPLKLKPDGGRRVVLAYMSIGEAEVYRFYWRPEWSDPVRRPAWIVEENPQWRGNFRVKFWDPEWQALIFGNPDAYLDRIIAAGFDGIYFDRADVYGDLGPLNPAAEQEMVRFITRLAAYARALKPEFLVIMQNAEELLDHAAVLATIDGIAKEDLYFGINHDARPNDEETVSGSVDMLRKARRAGRAVLVVEYLDEADKAREARRRAAAERFVLHFAPRELGELRLRGPDEQVQDPPAPVP